jgi:hypothetical protein
MTNARMTKTAIIREAAVLSTLERAARNGRPVSTPTIARLLKVAPGSAGDLMRRLEDQGKVQRAEPAEDALSERRTHWWTIAGAARGRCVSCAGKGWRRIRGRAAQCDHCCGTGRNMTGAERAEHRRWRGEVMREAEVDAP